MRYAVYQKQFETNKYYSLITISVSCASCDYVFVIVLR